jgi:hypothetical protein
VNQQQVEVSPFPGIESCPLSFGENEGAAPSSTVPNEAIEEAGHAAYYHQTGVPIIE